MGGNLRWASSPLGTKNALVLKDYVADYAADPTGAADNCPKLSTFGTFAKAGYSSPGSLPVKLTIPAGTFKHDATAGSGFGAQFFAQGVKDITVEGAGPTNTTFRIPQTNSWAPPFFGGLGQGSTASRIATVSAGATSVFCMTPAQAANFPAGRWAFTSGIDMQGVVDGNYGFPTNPQFFDFFKIISNNPATGEVVIDRPLTDSYKSTWALQYDGAGGNIPQGGPGYIYLLGASFDMKSTVKNLKFDLPNASTPWVYVSNLADMTVENVSMTGTSGICPSQNVVTRWINVDLGNSVTEVDKIIQEWYLDGCTSLKGGNYKIFFQSSSIKYFEVKNSDLNWLTGLGRVNWIENSTIEKLWFNNGYGAGKSTKVTNSTINEFIGSSSGYNVNNYPMTLGVIRTRRQMIVSNVTTSPGGKARITVDSTTDVGTGATYNFDALFTNRSGQDVVTVVDGVTVDLNNVTMATGGTGGNPIVWTGAGRLLGAAQSWATPGYWCNMIATGIVGNFQVLDQWNDNDYIYVQTNLAGGWPSGVTGFGSHPCMKFEGSNNLGCREILEHSMAPAQGKPIFSYVNRTYDKNLKTGSAEPSPIAWGELTGTSAMSINVTTPYTGVVGTLQFKPTQFTNQMRVWRSGALVNLNMIINVRNPGNRVYNASTQTWSGGQAGDTLPALQAGDRLVGTFISNPTLSADVSAESAGPVFTWEYTTDQGFTI